MVLYVDLAYVVISHLDFVALLQSTITLTPKEANCLILKSCAKKIGHPLSLLFFNTALEQLEIQIRANHKLQCMKSGTWEVKLLPYADNILLFISDRQKSFPNILDMVVNFGKYSWYKINWTKSAVMAISQSIRERTLVDSLFQWQ